ncbi:MAG: enoyl-CoA hydratase/isomerase family protein [Alphaproteobacteria bacterium]|nr:enoyl-CoA hydratase/isomerase family protein [Alphaproteobacteria bacterium]MBU1515170.1 enoyl-CoA hydratase/isomerase family protein [Alphaproteobacteria bacterium]MBU2092300.1 enoyl-CoA hydratase/isomerase family protein [Alphaproteobacteria bacterium]MBU2152894.1 enoyl-CoA hydratase/isomerase family protein [Alphaproteobacteria bacterium]MBU2305725.1 enoyl-CoA hydratase/isomerase family protein [Alphaproteobacteria bacterium]
MRPSSPAVLIAGAVAATLLGAPSVSPAADKINPRTTAAPRPENESIRLTRKSPAYWRITFANPPLNIVGPAEMRRLDEILDRIEADPRVKVVVFDSAVPGYFMAHYDLLKPLGDSTGMAPGPTGMHPVPDFMVRVARLKAVTISSIRGRTSGIGSEIVLATDMRFASREKALLSQFEVGAGFAPGGGPMARLPRLVGRGRAIEILIGAEALNGDLAERYGYVNRALPDAELDGFVDRLATRIAGFDHQAIIDTKHLVDVASLPPDEEIRLGWDAFITSVQRPAAQARVRALVTRGLQQAGDLEDHLNQRTADYREP